MSAALAAGLDFRLPPEREAHEPPEARGLARDEVRLMVSDARDGRVEHTRFDRLPDHLSAGDVLVVNASATLPAALPAARLVDGGTEEPVALHLSTWIAGRRWVVELRRRKPHGTEPLLDASAGERLRLPEGAGATLIAPYSGGVGGDVARIRLWLAHLDVPDVPRYCARHGAPIRYAYVTQSWPASYYQTVFSSEPGSAEMPSAGRAFTPRLLERLRRCGVRIARVLLHAGVSSQETDEPPYPERFRVPPVAAELVNHTRGQGGRVIAVGTTSLRALETVASADGCVRAGGGWTDIVITPERGVRAADALLTGWHAPGASHLAILEALGGSEHLARTYDAALRQGYLWHEFGDLHLLFGARREARNETLACGLDFGVCSGNGGGVRSSASKRSDADVDFGHARSSSMQGAVGPGAGPRESGAWKGV